MAENFSHSLNPSNSLWDNPEQAQGLPPRPPALSHPSLGALFFERLQSRENRPFCNFRDSRGRVASVSWGEAASQVRSLGAFLRSALGIQPQDRVAILSSTRYEWVLADLAILSVGAISTPIYQTSTAPEAGFILWDSGAQYIFVENQEQFDKVLHVSKNAIEVPGSDDLAGGPIRLSVKAVISFEPLRDSAGFPAVYTLSEVLKRDLSTAALRDFDGAVGQIGRKDLASIVYTSGTTGVFKGVMQTHENHLAMLEGVILSGLLGDAQNIFLYLPLAHSFARLIAYAAIAGGGNLLLPTVVDHERSIFDAKVLLKDIQKLEPQFFPSVPRIFEKIMGNMVGAGHSPRKRLISYAIKSYQELKPRKASGEALGVKDQLRLALGEALVAKARRTIFGNRFRYAISGGAPISLEVLQFFHSIGIMIFQGYGLTETTPALTANTTQFNRFGSVGRPFFGVEIKISPADGEVLARGGNIARGYWRRPRATEELWLNDGWFATGDIGKLDEEGYLYITDRKKELIVSSGGKKVAPAFLEGRIKSSRYISHAFVFGDQKPFLVALLTLELPAIKSWGAKTELANCTDDQLHFQPAVEELLAAEIERFNQDLSSYEQVKKFVILGEDFTVENGLLSPTLKLRRKLIVERYASEIEQLYKK